MLEASQSAGSTVPLDIAVAHTGGPSALRHKPALVEFGRFNGAHPEAWIFQAKRYFDFYSIVAEHKLTMASFYLDDFQRRCESLLNETMSLPEEYLVECFLSSLQPDILASVKAHKPTHLDQVIDLAHIHEQQLIAEKDPARPAFIRTQPLLPTPSPHSGPNSSSPNMSSPVISSPITRRFPIKRLTPAELQSRREQGLCFNCDEKYSATHCCKARPHLLLLVEESQGEVVLPKSFVSDDVLAEEPQCLEVQEHSAISYHALAGGASPNSLRFGSPDQVLLDGGSTHNLIRTRVARFLQLQVESTPHFLVVVGKGQRLPCEGVCRRGPITIQGSTLSLRLLCFVSSWLRPGFGRLMVGYIRPNCY
ncbi:hypothetical protein A4A49_37759 [Nicotiana attenuata]|uniref:Retrotransposon gag domain-containing protein n=1 Tax=Nicotiana attenuata TaxID=49451 RepID=A0A1J6IJ22_NICAT|nr:hypothetical protein A4A49_65179 [Nicotiana attenuata]OIT39591.1 hypothetical protein A4A49_37759 [Nicotiana attenuata]